VLVLVALAVAMLSRWVQRPAWSSARLLKVDSAVVALFALATIPLGYLIYQLYYSREGRVRRFPPGIMPVDRGHFILYSLRPDLRATALLRMAAPDGAGQLFTNHAIDAPLLQEPAGSRQRTWPSEKFPIVHYNALDVTEPPPAHWSRWLTPLHRSHPHHVARRKRRADFYTAGQQHIVIVRTLLAMVATDDQGKALAAEYTSLSDIYHGLGATRTSLVLGLLSGVVVTVLSPTWTFSSVLLSVVVAAPVIGALYYCVHINRSEVLRRLVGTAQYGLTHVLEAHSAAADVAATAGQPSAGQAT
jgi:hypothetical protein